MNKICSRCKVEWPIDQFVYSHRSPDKHDWYCKSCKSKLRKAYYTKIKNCTKIKPALKKCSSCLVVKTSLEFHLASDTLSGLRAICKKCCIKQVADYVKKHPEKKREWTKKYNQLHREELRKRYKNFRGKHREEINKKRRDKWHFYKKANQLWAKNNKDKIEYRNRRRRVRKLNCSGSHINAEWEAVKKQYDYKCASCNQEKKLTKDHIISLFHGGSDGISNIQPLCRSCNSKKGIKDIKYKQL